jgi:uncharacterized membrane protein
VALSRLGQFARRDYYLVDIGSARVMEDDMSNDFGEIVHEVKESPWKLGVIYFDPDDRRLIVKQRSGLGWTLNMAKPISWVLLLGVVALLVRNATKSGAKR